MAAITINLPDDAQKRARIVDALCDYGGYRQKLDDGTDNPVGRAAFAKDVVRGVIRDIVRSHERTSALAAAQALPDPELT